MSFMDYKVGENHLRWFRDTPEVLLFMIVWSTTGKLLEVNHKS